MSGGNKIKIFIGGTSVGGQILENVEFFKFGYFQWSGEIIWRVWKFYFFAVWSGIRPIVSFNSIFFSYAIFWRDIGKILHKFWWKTSNFGEFSKFVYENAQWYQCVALFEHVEFNFCNLTCLPYNLCVTMILTILFAVYFVLQ